MPEITREHWRRQPWKNGKGVTFEVLREPDVDDYDLRISLAEDPEPATFSTFPGYVRWSFLAGTAPIVLAQRGGTIVELLAMGDHVRAPGEVVMTSSLPAGPTMLFNVLARTSLVDAGAIVVGYGPVAHPVRFTFALEGQRANRFVEPTRVDTSGCVWVA